MGLVFYSIIIFNILKHVQISLNIFHIPHVHFKLLSKLIFYIFHDPEDPCMLYIVTFTINIPQMLAYIPYMDPMSDEYVKEFDLSPPWFLRNSRRRSVTSSVPS